MAGMSALDRVTIPRVLAHASACDTVTASYLFALRWEAGLRASDLLEARGHDRRAWNRQVGEQAVNACIVLSVLPALLSGLVFALARVAWPESLPTGVSAFCWVPIALAIAGLVIAYVQRRSWRAWTANEVDEGLAQASALRPRQGMVALGVLVVLVIATLVG
jgi:hypothetical protein